MHPQRFSNVRSGLLIVLLALGLGFAQAHSDALRNGSDVAWGPGPAHLPPGAEAAVLGGDPTKAAPVTLRLKFPAGYEIPPHWHPTQENVTVLSGAFHVGMGERFDRANGSVLSVGGFIALPAEENHYAWVEEETVVQVHLTGPFAITYVNPEDDPRHD